MTQLERPPGVDDTDDTDDTDNTGDTGNEQSRKGDEPAAGGLLGRLASGLAFRPRLVVLVVLVVAALGGIFGSSVLTLMSPDVGDPNAESQRAANRILEASGTGVTPDDLVLLVGLPSDWPSAAARARVQGVTDELSVVDGIHQVVSPSTLPRNVAPQAGLISFDGRSALVTAGLDAGADRSSAARDVVDLFADQDVVVGGSAAVELDIDDRIAVDLARAETLAFPLLMILGFWIFRGVIAALVPLLVGGLSIVTTLGALRLVTTGIDLSQYVLNLVIGLGLGLAIDYCLFMISRYREEILVDGYGRPAVIRTVRRAGHTVLFSAATVALAMATLMLFPQKFLYSMGIGGVLVTLVAATLSVTLLPALLILLGPRIDAWSLPRWKVARERESADAASGRWYSLSRWVMRFAPTLFPLAVLVALLVASPALDTKFGDVDQTSLPTSSPPRQVSDRLAAEFPDGDSSSVYLAVTAGQGAAEKVGRLATDATRAGGTGVRQPVAPAYLGDDLWLISLTVDAPSYDEATTSVVDRVRALRADGEDLSYLVGGNAAAFVDLESSIASHLPWALLIVSVAVLLVMFLLTGSVVLSVKTLILNALNVAMTFGVLVWIFQYGHLEWLLRFESVGRIDLMQPILVAIIAFGLSTDYGVFLFARIMESHDEGSDDTEAVAQGLGRSGRIISSAALLLCIAIGAFSTSSILFIKQLGVGAAVAVFLDATLVRALLVPSAMQLMGSVNWWAPAWLRRITGPRRSF